MTAGQVRHPGAALSDDAAAFGVYALPPAREALRRIGQRLGRGAAARRMCSLIRRIVTRGLSGPFDVEAFPGQRARLYPDENLSDKRVFAGVQFWDWAERVALGRTVRAAREPVYVVDAGANAGLYTLAIRAEAGDRAIRILAIEPDPENLARLRFNLAASGADDVTVAQNALSDCTEEVFVEANHANRGELRLTDSGTPVTARPLLDLIQQAGFPRVDALKIDIEGMEERVLTHYLSHAHRDLWPKTVILEAQRGAETPALAYMLKNGYRVTERTKMNAVLRRNAGPDETAKDKTNG